MGARNRRSKNEFGAVAVAAVLGLFVVLGIAALSVDLGMLVVARTQLGIAADAAALAAVKELPFGSRDRARLRAVEYAARNRALGDPVALQAVAGEGGDVALGFYDLDSRSFRPDDLLPNAVQVTARRAAKRGTGVPIFFAALWRREQLSAGARSIAIAFPREEVLCLDASASMGKYDDRTHRCGVRGFAPIESAREAAADFLRNLGLSTLPERAGVLSYAYSPVVRSPIVGIHDRMQPGPLIDSTLAIEAQACGDSGATNTGRAIDRAIQMFEEDEDPGRVAGRRMIVLVSDGLANRGRNVEEEYGNEADSLNAAWHYAVAAAGEARSRGIAVHTIALFDNEQLQQMQEIAEAGGGTCLEALTTEYLDEMFDKLAKVVPVALVDSRESREGRSKQQEAD